MYNHLIQLLIFGVKSENDSLVKKKGYLRDNIISILVKDVEQTIEPRIQSSLMKRCLKL